MNRLLLQELLKPYGEVHIAVNGKEAVEAVRVAMQANRPYDLVCLDIMMPEMDGQTALHAIRRMEESKGITSTYGAKIVMTTAVDDQQNIISAFRSLCDGYLVKPIDRTKLLDQLKTLGLLA